MKKERWGKEYEDKRNWREYNEKLVARGKAYVSLDFVDSWNKDLEHLNGGGGCTVRISRMPDGVSGIFTCAAEYRFQSA